MEKWKDIVGYENLYQISNTGKVKSFRRSNVIYLQPKKDKKKYLFVSLSVNKVIGTYKIHRLVAQAYLPNPDNLPQVNHLDGDKNNNNEWNLEWCTNLDNMRHAWKTGLKNSNHTTGEKNVNSKLTKVLVQEIREKYATKKYSQTELAREYSVCCATIYNVITNKIWT